jgi:hypothetical protein
MNHLFFTSKNEKDLQKYKRLVLFWKFKSKAPFFMFSKLKLI